MDSKEEGMNWELVRKGDLPESVERLSHTIIGCALEVHTHLGPGLLEKIYEQAVVFELRTAGLHVDQQREIEIRYKDIVLRGQRIDLLVEGTIVVENKSVAKVQEIDRSQLLGYLRAVRQPLGLLFNFNTIRLKDGIHRIFNEKAIPPRS